jgi:hypothetical protein
VLVAIPRAVHQDVDRLGLADDQVVDVSTFSRNVSRARSLLAMNVSRTRRCSLSSSRAIYVLKLVQLGMIRYRVPRSNSARLILSGSCTTIERDCFASVEITLEPLNAGC